MSPQPPRPERLDHGTVVYTAPPHQIGTDGLLLARFCPPRRAQQAADLGSGCGVVALTWHDGGHRGPCAAVERNEDAHRLLARALAEQPEAAAHIRAVWGDLRRFGAGEGPAFDLVACNPPYFTAGRPSPDPARAAARHEETATFAEVAACAARLLRDGGRFAFCLPPDRLAQAFGVLAAARLEPKRLRFVKKEPQRAPWLFLCEAQKNRRPGLRVEPDLCLQAGARYGEGRADLGGYTISPQPPQKTWAESSAHREE